MKTFILSIILLVFFACNANNKPIAITQSHIDSMGNITTEFPNKNDSVFKNFEESFYPKIYDSINEFNILPLNGMGKLSYNQFHEDEVLGNVNEKKWFGLILNSTSDYEISKIKLSSKRVKDAITEEFGAWEIESKDKNCILAIEENKYIQPDKFLYTTLINTTIYPGNELDLNGFQKSYRVFATGTKSLINSTYPYYDVTKYSLFIKEIGSKKEPTLLVRIPNFDDNMVEVLLCSDLDGDNIPDFIIDTSRHYNTIETTLYLSKSAKGDTICKPMAIHTSVGC